MSEPNLRVVFYRGNSYPRSVAVDTRRFRRGLLASSLALVMLTFTLGIALRWYAIRQAKHTVHSVDTQTGISELYGPLNSTEEQARALKDEVERLESRVKTLVAEREAPKEIDSHSAVLALFSPVVSDQTKSQNQVVAKNFTFSAGGGKEPMTLSFELHNSEPGASVQKGYIVVLARTKTSVKAYPNVFNSKGPYLVDFERGESFQVSRFRIVNAQFDSIDLKDPVSNFQILIFKRTGELLLNLLTEVNKK